MDSDPTHRTRLLVDLAVWDFLASLKRKDRDLLEGALRRIASDPLQRPDGEATDEVGRAIALFVAGPFVIRAWQDAADHHTKILQIIKT
jgi:hypothetical protein